MSVTVTFVMPAFNAEAFIADAIRSLQAQTVREWKLIIVNDGSTDNTLDIARSFASEDTRITVKSLRSSSGSAFLPRKTAIETAETEYVSPIDADDWIDPDYLENLLACATDKDPDLVYPTMWLAKGSGNKDFGRFAPAEDCFYDHIFLGKELIKYTLDGWRIGANGGLIKKELYKRAFDKSDIDSSLIYADELLTRYILLHADRIAISKAKYYYRNNDSSVTHIASPRAFEYLINNLLLIKFCKNVFSETSEEYILAQRQNFHGVFGALLHLRRSGLKGTQKDEVMRMIRKAESTIDYKLIRPHVSPRYYALLHLPFSVITEILSLYERYRSRKQL